jgi:hypothetical protein
MSRAELDRLEGDVREARQRLKSDLEVLRGPGTFSSFKDELVAEARQSGAHAMDQAKAGATNWSERLIADIKERAAANPIAVGAIAAGIGWRILRKPPVTTMLVGYGLYSLWQTQPGTLAPGAEAVYRAADAAVAAKEQVQQWGKEAGETLSQASGSVETLATSVSDRARRLGADVGTRVGEATSSVQAMATSGSRSVHGIAVDQQQRDKMLLSAAAIAITTALGLTLLRRAQPLNGPLAPGVSDGRLRDFGRGSLPHTPNRAVAPLGAV